MRPSQVFFTLIFLIIVGDGLLIVLTHHLRQQQHEQQDLLLSVTAALGLTDLCISTEARYTRHPAISDPVAPFMDHPGAIEHFPTGTFWSAPAH